MNTRFWFALVVACSCLVAVENGQAQERFSQIVGPVKVGAMKSGTTVQVPFITWGGDVATFYANGGLTTTPTSIYGKMGLKLKLVPGDDFVGQVKQYLQGDSPFLRGTMRMIGQASETIGADPRTKPVVLLQMTWSAGDHMVSRNTVKTLNDLKGKKVALQRGGPHVGMLDDILQAAKLKWDDITVVWTDELTGPGSPAEKFRDDKTIDACMVISPDMIGLTGGLESKGTGAEGTVKDAGVLISTATMTRSIADVYACRKDYFDANRPMIEKFVAGYLKACEEIVPLKQQYEKTGNSPKYVEVLKLAQSIYGKDVLPTLEIDAHGLIADCTYVGLPGNASFFTDKGNLNGFEAKQKAALDLATGQGYAAVRAGFFSPDFDYNKIKQLGGLTQDVGSTGGPKFVGEGIDVFPDSVEGENTILSFTINFEPNQTQFGEEVYGPEFLRAVQAASTFGNAVVVIRGHSDPTKTLVNFIQAGMQKGVIRRAGTSGNYRYFIDGKPLDLEATADVMKHIENGSFDGTNPNPRETMQAALNLSRARAEQVRDAVIEYAKDKDYRLDATQIRATGVGVIEPLIPKPKSIEEAKQNMRVEFRLMKVPAEVARPSDFDF